MHNEFSEFIQSSVYCTFSQQERERERESLHSKLRNNKKSPKFGSKYFIAVNYAKFDDC